MDKLNVEGYLNLKRDINSGAILNTDTSEYENYLKAKMMREYDRVQLDTAFNEISMLKSEISEIKELLFQLVKK